MAFAKSLGENGRSPQMATVPSHRTSSELTEVVILEVGDNFLSVRRCVLLEDRNSVGIRRLKVLLDGLHVPLEVAEVLLLVERGLLETERMHNVDDLLSAVLEGLGLLLGRGVSSNVDLALGDDNLGGVELDDDIVDLLGLVCVGAELITRNDVQEKLDVSEERGSVSRGKVGEERVW